MPAFEAGMAEQQAEIDAIVNNPETPTFENTILPYDKSGETLERVSNVFFNLNECLTDDEMVSIAEQVLPLLSKHSRHHDEPETLRAHRLRLSAPQ